MRFKKIIKMFEKGNVCVTGLRGTGKDLLFGNVIFRRKEIYISNLDYDKGKRFIKLDLNKLEMKNTYHNLIKGNVNYFEWSYPMGSDIYLSDAGVYFPSQYCNRLNNEYPTMPIYQALSRQVSRNNFHINTQNLNRLWDKIREQSDIYITCNKCIYLFGIVIQKITIYDKYQSCIDRVKPCRIRVPLMAKSEVKQSAKQYLDNWTNTHGKVTSHILFYYNKSKHDTYYFEKLFKGGVIPSEEKNNN